MIIIIIIIIIITITYRCIPSFVTWTVLDNSPGKMGLSDRSGNELESIRSVGNWAYLHLHHREIWVWSPRWQHTIDHHRSPSWLKDTVAPEVLLASHVEARTTRTPGPWGTARFLRYHQCSSSERGVSSMTMETYGAASSSDIKFLSRMIHIHIHITYTYTSPPLTLEYLGG